MGRIKKIPALVTMAIVICVAMANAQVADTIKKSSPKPLKNLQVEARWTGGFVMAHRPTVVYVQRQHIQGFEATLSKPLNGKQPWHTFYPRATYGVTSHHSNLGYNEVLGKAYGAYAFLRFNVWGHKGARLRFSIGEGIVWITKPFDKEQNHKNITIGSHINALINLQLTYEQRITKNIFINAGIGLTHYSNGAFTTPNLGLNMPSVSLGATYKFYPEPIEKKYQRNEFTRSRRIIPSFILNIGGKQIYPPDGKRYGVFTLMANFLYPIGIKSGLLLSIDVFNDRSQAAILRHNNPNTQLSYFKTVRPGIAIGHDLWLGRMSFVFQAGVYPYTYYKGDGLIYSRLGLRYLFGKHLLANITLKTHFAKADNVEFGLGYSFGWPRVVRLL